MCSVIAALLCAAVALPPTVADRFPTDIKCSGTVTLVPDPIPFDPAYTYVCRSALSLSPPSWNILSNTIINNTRPTMPVLRSNRQKSRKVVENEKNADKAARRKVLRDAAKAERNRVQSLPWWGKVNDDPDLQWRAFWNRNCRHCGTRLLDVEPDTFCCRNGKQILPRLPQYPDYFLDVVEQWRRQNSFFVRKLNNLFSFTAIGVTGGFARGIWGAVAITGRVYHRLLSPETGAHSWRWFLYDSHGRNEAAERLQVPPDLVEATRRMLEERNPFLRSVRSAIETTEEQSYSIHLDQDPAGGEVAALISAHNLAEVRGRKIVVRNRNTNREDFVDLLSPSYEPLQYPVLFPCGTAGWSVQNPQRLSQINWYKSRLLQEPRFKLFGRLACEYLVDMYSRVEEQRLQFLHQGRQEQYSRVRNFRDPHVQAAAVDPSIPTLENSIPASFLGSREWSSKQVADSLALAREYGKPSLFVTVTTNPNWPEILEMLEPGQKALDIPVVVARVFHARLMNMISWMRKNFKDVAYIVRVTEFQKRGLPHAHILLRVST